jgi:hypothetical protein
MTEALNRHLPERPRLRVPLRPRSALARSRCRSRLASALKPSSLPFEALKAMSENPALLKRFWSLLPLLLWAAFSPSLGAAEALVTKALAASATNAPAVVGPAAEPTVKDTPTAEPKAEQKTEPKSESKAESKAGLEPDRDGRPRGSSSTSSRDSAAAPTNAPPGTYEYFRLVVERNIFDPNRSPRMTRSNGEEPRRAPKVEAFALAGTMSFSNRHMAFFTSSSSQYQKALKPGDAIAGYQIANVAPDHVKLEKDGAAVELKLNQQMRREDDGPWQVSARTDMAASAPASPGAGTGASANGGAAAAPAGASDALKRLMELRAKEQ